MLSPLRRTDPDTFVFDWRPVVVALRVPARDYTATTLVRPRRANGYYAECTTAGQTAMREPVWPQTAGVTVQDGSAVWTMRAPSSVSLPTISAVTYTIAPSGITQSGAAISGNLTSVKFDASAAELGMYDLLAEATIGGEDFSLSDTIIVVD